jgi:hypothetical protein
MNCPNCGSQVLAEQQFCRKCGAGLAVDTSRPADRRMLVGLSMAFGGIIVALFGRMLLHIDVVVLVGVLLSICGMFFIAAYPLLRRSLRPRTNIIGTSQPESLAAAEPTNKLPPMSANDFVGSVTENTTDLLNVSGQDHREQ